MVNTLMTETISAIGEGRKDYSADILFSSEPLIRGEQYVYYARNTFSNVPVNGIASCVFTVTSGVTAFIFTACASTMSNSLIRMVIERYENGLYTACIDKYGFLVVTANNKAGVPFNTQYKVVVYNYGNNTQNIEFYTNGIQIDTLKIS